MFTSYFIAASLSFLAVLADVDPTTPSNANVYKSGGPCVIAWNGDTNATTLAAGAWKDMVIELMDGGNLDMIHLTTVATGQDGTVAGTFTHTCPEVTVNAQIYFYQFTSPHTPDVQWTTRFTIASDSGATVADASTTIFEGQTVGFGYASLVDTATAVAAPIYSSGSLINIGDIASTTSDSSSSTSTTTSTTSTSTSTSASSFATSIKSSSTSTSSTTSSSAAATSNAAAAFSQALDLPFVQAIVVLVGSAMGFALL